MTPEVQAAIIVAVPPTIAATAALIVSLRSHRALGELHVSLNSRLDQWLAATEKASFAEGAKSETDKLK